MFFAGGGVRGSLAGWLAGGVRAEGRRQNVLRAGVFQLLELSALVSTAGHPVRLNGERIGAAGGVRWGAGDLEVRWFAGMSWSRGERD